MESNWLTLSQASELLGVHPTTLRAWVKSGRVHAFLTPGGHRRFQLGELRAFLVQRRAGNSNPTGLVPADQTLHQIREQLRGGSIIQQPWYNRLTDSERARHRNTGQRLLGLLLQFVSVQDEAEQFISEARSLARDYGQEFARANVPIAELAQAFILFRRMIVTAACYPRESGAHGDPEGMRLLNRIELFMDELLIATLDGYSQENQGETTVRANIRRPQVRRIKSR
jgi:excisionase family DNA binding protein